MTFVIFCLVLADGEDLLAIRTYLVGHGIQTFTHLLEERLRRLLEFEDAVDLML